MIITKNDATGGIRTLVSWNRAKSRTTGLSSHTMLRILLAATGRKADRFAAAQSIFLRGQVVETQTLRLRILHTGRLETWVRIVLGGEDRRVCSQPPGSSVAL